MPCLCSRRFSGHPREPEELAKPLPPRHTRNAADVIYAARLVDDALIAFTRAPQRVRAGRIGLKG